MLDHLVFFTLLGLISIAPLPFGSDRVWAWPILTVITAILVVVKEAAILLKLSQREISVQAIKIPGLLFMGAIAWALFQTSSWSPTDWHHPLWKDSAEMLGLPYSGSIALDPIKAKQDILKLLTSAGIFWLAFQYCRKSKNALTALYVLAVSDGLYAFYGFLIWALKINKVLWITKYAYVGDLTGTFINRNNYATYAGLGWLCFMALLYLEFMRRTDRNVGRREGIRQALVFFEKSGWYLLGGCVLQATALLLTHSRAGFASTIIALTTFFIFLGLGYKSDRRLARNFAAFAIGSAVVFYLIEGQVLGERLARDAVNADERFQVYWLTLKAIADQPILGIGLGAFEEVFRFYRTSSVTLTFDYAHNSYLESALELGVPAAATLLAALVFLFAKMINGCLTRRRDALYPCIGAASMVLVGMHSLVDFSIQIPAVSFYFAFLVGLGSAHAIRTNPT